MERLRLRGTGRPSGNPYRLGRAGGRPAPATDVGTEDVEQGVRLRARLDHPREAVSAPFPPRLEAAPPTSRLDRGADPVHRIPRPPARVGHEGGSVGGTGRRTSPSVDLIT